MKYLRPVNLTIGLFLLCSCTLFATGQSAPAPEVQSHGPLVLPAGKNWQIIEEAPQLSDERGRLPFQTEQSLQPEGTTSVIPVDNRKIETTR